MLLAEHDAHTNLLIVAYRKWQSRNKWANLCMICLSFVYYDDCDDSDGCDYYDVDCDAAPVILIAVDVAIRTVYLEFQVFTSSSRPIFQWWYMARRTTS